MFKNGIGYCPTLRRCFVSTDIAFFETTPFSLPSTITSPREDDDLLVYYASLLVPTPNLIPIKPLITQAYSQRQNPLVSSPPLAASTSGPVLGDDLPIALHKGKRQCAHPISSFFSYDHLSSHYCSFIASLDSISLPNKVSKALAHPGWRSAMIEEMNVLTDNGTRDLVCLPTGKKPLVVVGCLQ